jgi:hypothetical protein
MRAGQCRGHIRYVEHVSVVLRQCRLCVVMKQWLAMNVISFVFTNCQQRSVIWVGRSLVLWLCGHCGLRCGTYARSSTRFSTRIVCNHCNFGEIRLLWWGYNIVDRIHVVHIHRHRGPRGGSASADVDAARSSFATLSPAPCSLGATQWPLILSGILSSFFQYPNLISFYIFSLQMLRHFEVTSKLLSLFPLLHCVTVMSSLFLHFSTVERVITNPLSG